MSTAAQSTPAAGDNVRGLPSREEAERTSQRVADLDRWSGSTGQLIRTGVPVTIRGRVAVAEPTDLAGWKDACKALQVLPDELRRWDPSSPADRVWVERHYGPFKVRVQVDASIALDEDREARAERALVAAAEALS